MRDCQGPHGEHPRDGGSMLHHQFPLLHFLQTPYTKYMEA